MLLQERVTVPRSVADCFRYLVDFSTCEQWDPGVERARKVTPGKPGVGTRFDLTLAFAGRSVPMTYELSEVVTDCRLVLSGRGEGFRVTDTIELAAHGGETVIDYRSTIHFLGPGRHIARWLRPWFNRMGRRAVAGLGTTLSPGAEPSDHLVGALAHRTLLPAMVQFTRRGYRAMPDKGLSDFMDGRVVVVTGATGGLGLAAAQALARLGASVTITGRDAERLAAARRAIADYAGIEPEAIRAYQADMLSLTQVRDLAECLRRDLPAIDVLINNAGALFAKRVLTEDGVERSMAINLVSPFVLTEALAPALGQAGARVVNVASGGMYTQALALDDMNFDHGEFDGAKAYARAKRGLVALTEHWAQSPGFAGVDVHAMHPGWAATPGVAKSLPAFNRRLQGRLRDARMGADTMVWLASSPRVAGRSGEFWFDRQPRPKAILPGTTVTQPQREQLMAWLERAAA
ncbi:MAG: SDR family NAD(P)-dependent oxidoreductase [Salinisphaeraceae bacterium]